MKLERVLAAFLAFHSYSYNSSNTGCPRSLLLLPRLLVLVGKKPCSWCPRKDGFQAAAIGAQLAAPRAVLCPDSAVSELGRANTEVFAQNVWICVFYREHVVLLLLCCPNTLL